MIIGVDLLYHLPHGLSRAAILAGEEDAEAGTGNQPDHAKHKDDDYRDPAACGNGGDQRLCSGNDRFDRRNGGFCGNLNGLYRSLGCRLCRLYGFLRRFCGSLCRHLGGLSRGLRCFYCCPPGLLRGFDPLLCDLYGALSGRLCRFERTLSGFLNRLLCGFFRLGSLERILAFLNVVPCFTGIALRIGKPAPSAFLQLNLGSCHTSAHGIFDLLCAVLLRRSLRRSGVFFSGIRSVLGANGGRFDAFRDNGSTVNGLDRTPNRLFCFNIRHDVSVHLSFRISSHNNALIRFGGHKAV